MTHEIDINIIPTEIDDTEKAYIVKETDRYN